ncbi:MAG: YihY family inner membrane protein [candidate division NC10 bacterium]|nr:YihY family inner membrane protein [candidate division NC10 bacterium]
MNAEHRSHLDRLTTLIAEDVWVREPEELPQPVRFLYRPLRLLSIVAYGFVENRVSLQASALTFSMLLSIAPFLAVAFSVLKAFGVQNRLRPTLAELLSPLGPSGEEITTRLVTFVNNVNVGALGAVGLVTLFITIVSLMGNIEHSFNQIWGVTTPRRMARRFSDYLSVLLVGPVLVFAGLGVIASLQSSAVMQGLMAIEPFGTLILAGLRLLPYLTLWGAFSFMYVFLPNTSVRLPSALLGGLVAAVLWVTVGWGFAAFVTSSTKYAAIYSSFAILLFFLLWFYVGWVIVLLGAEVAYAHQYLDVYQGGRKASGGSVVDRERLALGIMLLVGKHFLDGKPPLTADALANRLKAPAQLVKELLQMLAGRHLLRAVSDGQGYLPARDLERIGVKEILDSLRTFGELQRSPVQGDQAAVVGQVISEVDRVVATTLAGRSLKSLLVAQDPPHSHGD